MGGAGAQSKILQKIAFRPNAPTGHFQRHIDSAFGTDPRKEGEFRYRIDVPQHRKSDVSRTTTPIPVNPIHESLCQEINDKPGILDNLRTRVTTSEWADDYWKHPIVANSAEPVLPVALYCDGIEFTKRDGVLGFFAINLITEKRHLIGGLRRSSMCRCGCRHWCSLYSFWSFVHWCCDAIAR